MLAARPGPAAGRARSAWRRRGAPRREERRPTRPSSAAASSSGSSYGGSTMTTSNGPCRGARRAAQPAERLGPRRSARRPAEVGPREVRGDDRGRARVALDEGRVRRATRQRLDPGRAATREEVEERGAAEVRLEDREQRLLDPVAQRPRPVAGRVEAGSRARVPAMTRPASATVRVTRRVAGSAGGDAAQPAVLELRGERPDAAGRPPVARRAAPRRARGPGQQGRDGPRLERGDAQAREAALGEAQDVALACAARSPSRRARTRRGSRRPPRSRGRAVSSVESETSTQNDSTEPRPTRPRSWWSWASPNRSAPSMTIIVASGTSTPTSTTVVPTRTSSSPSRNRVISASRSAAFSRPWTSPTRSGREQLAQPARLRSPPRRRRSARRRRPPPR